MYKKTLAVFCLTVMLLSGLPVKAGSTPTISVNDNKMLSDGKVTFNWNINTEAEYCGVDYGLKSDMSSFMGNGGDLIQTGLPTNDGKFYYAVTFLNLQTDKDYYYKVVCILKGDTTIYQTEIKKLDKYQSTPSAPTYSLNVSKTGTGSGTVFEGSVLEEGSVINCGSKCSTSFLPGASVTLTASPAAGSVFTSWTGCGSTNNSTCTVSMNEIKNVVANFSVASSYSLNVSKTGTGSGTVFEGSVLEMGSVINCGSTCSASFLPNAQTITLTASPSDGSVFTSWTGCGSNTTNPVCVVQINENKNIVANFSAFNKSLPDIVADNANIFDGTNENKILSVAPKAGEKFYLWLAYKNMGNVKTNNTAFYVDVYIDDIYTKRLKASNNDYLSNLGDSMGVNEKLELALKEGSHKIKFILDSENIIKESNEENNIYVKTINVEGIKTPGVTDSKTTPVVVTNKDTNSNTTNNASENNSVVLKLQRMITELEAKVIELEKSLTKLDEKFAAKYSGTMFLDVQNQGRLWYVDPASKNRFYFENGDSALSIGSELATGITYENLQKIPVGVPDSLYNLTDTDADGLPDNLEVALGTDPNKVDTDGDGRSDKAELLNGYNPAGSEKYVYDQKLIGRLEGKMMLQVSGPNSHGEIWYIYKGKRWYGGTKDSMYEIMKSLSLGATADNIRKISVGSVTN